MKLTCKIKYNLNLFFLLGSIISLPIVAFSQNTRFRHLSVDDGLVQNSINAITQDKSGFMWFATSAGLNRYDGLEVKTFRHSSNDPTTISDNSIVFIFADSDNKLWIGTRWSGLNRLDLTTHKITRIKFDPKGNGFLNNQNMLCASEDKNGILYFGTNGGGINVYNRKTNKFTYITNNSNDTNSIANNSTRSLTFDKNGQLWIGHSQHGGVSCYNLKTKKAIRFTDGSVNLKHRINGSNSVKAVFCDSKNRIWISTWAGGLNIYDQRQMKMYSNSVKDSDNYFEKNISQKYMLDSGFGKSTSSSKYSCLKEVRMSFGFTEDRFGNIWIATVEQGLICFNPETGKLRQFKNNPNDATSICDNNLLSIYVDKSGIVWVGSLSAGLSIFNPYSDKFGYYKADSNQPYAMENGQVWSVHVGKYTHNTYVAVLGNIYCFDPEKNRFIKYVINKKGATLMHPQAIVQALTEDYKGNLWISVNGSGVFVYDTTYKKLDIYNYINGDTTSLMNSAVTTIFEDKFKNIWLGVDSWGMDKFLPDSKTFKHHYYHKSGNSIASDIVRHITDTKDGNLLVSTDSGLCMMNPITGVFTNYRNIKNNSSSLPGNDVQTIYRDKRNKIWVGTSNGLCSFDEKKKQFTDYTKKYKVAVNGVFGITEDLNNNLWLLSSRGVSRFNTVTYKWKEYDVSDGLQSNEFPSNLITSLDNGNIMMGGSKGLNYFDPELLIENRNIPTIVLTNFLLRNHPIKTKKLISYRKEVNLDYDHYFFTIEFASLDYTNTAKNKYKYKLEGFNNEWVDLGNKKQVTFVNLDPGEYTFRVSGSNNDGIWNEQGATLKIIITPPFWQTYWFYTLCFVLAITLLYAYIKYREAKLTKEKQVLENKVNIRTIELREEKEKVEEANKEIRDSINYAKKIQHAIMPSEDDLKNVLPKSFVFFKPKDIVSGDFYWLTALHTGEILIATADCTGHGVPGGFMSMLGSSFLNEIVNEQNITQPDKVLTILREKIIASLKQTGVEGENKDGMDITLLKINKITKKAYFAGANNPLWIIKSGSKSITEIKPDKQPIGYYINKKDFTLHEIDFQEGDAFYTFTDGFADQFGGPKGKKFKYSQLQQLLIDSVQNKPEEQKIILENNFSSWKGNYEQTDDVCVIGIII